MANIKDSSKRWPSHIAEKFEPPSFWTEDANGNHILDIHLPGFKHEEVRIEVPSAGHIQIEGERIVNENKCIFVDNTFPLPENVDIDNIVGKFEAERLQITVPTLPKQNKAEEEEEEEDSDDHDSENGDTTSGESEKEEELNNNNNINDKNQKKDDQVHVSDKKGKRDEINSLMMVIKCLKRNKGLLLSIVVSFSVGIWASNLWIKYAD